MPPPPRCARQSALRTPPGTPPCRGNAMGIGVPCAPGRAFVPRGCPWWRWPRRGAPGGAPPAIATVTLVKAADVSGSLADQSGTAVVRIVHNGLPWAGSRVRWSGRDLSVSRSDGEEFRVVGGTFYALDTGRW